MLNEKGQRELAYVVSIDAVKDIEGVMNQVAVVNGWTVFVKRDEFKPGDLAIYFEIDSRLPADNPVFDFMAKYNYKVKTRRFVKGKVLSQGLLVKPSDLGLKKVEKGQFLTKELKVTYAEDEDNIRKAENTAYISMVARHPKVFKSKFGKWLLKHNWTKKIAFLIWGKKSDKGKAWPSWVKKTDEERCQNCFQQMKDLNEVWIATEKIDGSSGTFTMKQAKPNHRIAYVCSRNVVLAKLSKKDTCDSDKNIYFEIYNKYKIRKFMEWMLDSNKTLEYITIQGEIYGGAIQKRNYGDGHRFAMFNLIVKYQGLPEKRMDPRQMQKQCQIYRGMCGEIMPTIDIVSLTADGNELFTLPKTCDELLALAGGKSTIDGGMREGIVLRSEKGTYSFKAVDNKYLEKYHG